MLLFFYSGNQTKAFLLTHKTWQSLAVIVGTLPKPKLGSHTNMTSHYK